MNKLNCMLCGKELEILFDILPDENEGIVQKGLYERIYPGYGSRFDNLRIDVVLCDDCIEKHFINKQTSDKKDN